MRNYITRILLCVAFFAAANEAWATNYVISYTSGSTTHFMSRSGSSIVDTEKFDPATCIWTCSGTTSGKLSNGGYYIYRSSSSLSLTTNNYSASSFTIDSDNNSVYSGNRYIYLNGTTWTAGRNITSYASAYSVEATSGGGTGSVNISRSKTTLDVGDKCDVSVTSVTYNPAYNLYTLSSGTTYYCTTADKYVGTSAPTAVTTASVYAWTSSVSGTNLSLTDTDKSTVYVSYDTNFTTQTTATLTATVTIPQTGDFMTDPVTITGTASLTLSKKAKPAFSFSVSPTEMYIGQTAQATLTAPNGITVTYSSSNESVATISSDGKVVTGVGVTGTGDEAVADIKAVFAGNDDYVAATASVPVKVKKLPTTVTLTYDKNTLTFGDAAPTLLSCVVTDTQSGNVLTGGTVTYSNDKAFIRVDNSGVITYTKAGTGNITVTYQGDATHAKSSATVEITVNKASTTLSFPQTTYSAKTTQGFDAPEATLSPSGAGTVTYSYTGTTENLMTIDKNTGKVTLGTVDGTATVTATFAGNDNYTGSTASYKLTVTALPAPTITEDVAPKTELYVDETFTPHLTTSSTAGFEYASSDATVLTVAADGTMTGLKAGTATLSITSKEDANYAPLTLTYTVTVKRYPTTLTIGGLQSTYFTDYSGTITATRMLISPQESGKTVDEPVVYTSSDTSVLTVDASTGVVTLVSAGVASITATFEGTTKYEASQASLQMTISRAVMPGDFIRLKDSAGKYVTSDGTSISVTSTDADAASIIYYGEDLSLLFYQCGRYINDANPTLADVVSVGTTGTAFTIARDVDKYTISDGTNSLASNGSTEWTIEEVESLPLTFKTAGYGYSTLYCPEHLRCPAGVTAYYPTKREADTSGAAAYVITLKEVPFGELPANTPLVLYARDITSPFDFHIINEAQTLSDLGDFMTGTYPTVTTASAYSGTQWPYTLQPVASTQTVGFYPWKSDKHSSIEPFRCYIPGDKASQAKGFRFVFDGDDTTGIAEAPVSSPDTALPFYNLHGIAVGTDINALPSGVYVRAGKKVVKK
jgi:uncharacterized protein YjdB